MAPSRDRRPGFSRRAQYGLFAGYVIAGAGLVVAVALLIISAISPRAFAGLRSGAAEVTAPVSTGLSSVVRGIGGIPDAIGTYFGVHAENAQLHAELTRAHRLLIQARTLSRENARLRVLLRLRDGSNQPVIVARLVSSSATSTRRFALLNAGWRQNVAEGQPVRASDGLVGRVLEVGPDTARVLLLTDPESAVPARRTRDGAPAIVGGRGDGMVQVRSAQLGSIVLERGDLFVTSGAGGIYPPGVPVARIVEKARDSALARPFVQPGTFDFALVERPFLPPPPPPAAPANAKP